MHIDLLVYTEISSEYFSKAESFAASQTEKNLWEVH